MGHGGHGLVHSGLLLHLIDHVVVLGHREGGELEAQPPSLQAWEASGTLFSEAILSLMSWRYLGPPSRPCRRHSCTPSMDTSTAAARCWTSWRRASPRPRPWSLSCRKRCDRQRPCARTSSWNHRRRPSWRKHPASL